MSKVSMSSRLPASAKEVWKMIGNFHSLPDWHPAVEKSEEEDGGEVRRLHLVGGGEIVERLVRQDDGSKTYTYRIVSGPLPVRNYTGTIEVHEDKDGEATIQWSSEFDAEGDENEAVKAIEGIYEAGFANLRKMLGG
jgi:hypothetical protein